MSFEVCVYLDNVQFCDLGRLKISNVKYLRTYKNGTVILYQLLEELCIAPITELDRCFFDSSVIKLPYLSYMTNYFNKTLHF